MDREEYVQTIEDSLQASFFEGIQPKEALGVNVTNRILNIPIGVDSEKQAFVDEFSCFYRETETDGFMEPDLREVAIIYKPAVSNAKTEKRPVARVRDIINTAREHYEKTAPERDQKVFIFILFIDSEAEDVIHRAIKNGTTVQHPDYVLLPILADLNSGRLTYSTEQSDSSGLLSEPFIDQATEKAKEHFRVSSR